MCSAEQRVTTTDDTAVDKYPRLGAAQLARAINEKIHELEGDWVGGEYDFVCECDDHDCTRVVRISASEYENLRALPGHFAVLPGHQQPTDVVVGRGDHHLVARKPSEPNRRPPKRATEPIQPKLP